MVEETSASAEYLSSLRHLFLAETTVWGVIGCDTAAHGPEREAAPLSIGGNTYAKGIGHHAPGQLVLDRAGLYDEFLCEVGVQDQGGGSQGSVTFSVIVDGQTRFESGVIREGDPAERNEREWFDLGGFAKVQPDYGRYPEIYAMRGDRKPFLRSCFNMLASLLNTGNLSLWEHFNNVGACNKTHETGYFLQQTRMMLVNEYGDELWLAPFAPSERFRDGCRIVLDRAPPRSDRPDSALSPAWGRGMFRPR
ncbi:MAG: hypothetical protein KatS3mg024_1519 [Armatimonadota bacterium]|nr:MAG: hypothetical protein KatS3mg024_1519 [Armatimonadota bacterium]